MSEAAPPATVSAAPVAPASPAVAARLAAEVAGTFVLVFGVIGTALFAAGFDGGTAGLNVGFLGVALALGLSVLVSAYAFGPVSGGHFNPAVTIGLAIAGRFAWKDVAGYIVAQIVGGIIASSLLVAIAAGGPDGFLANAQKGGFASTGWGELSPGGFGLVSSLLVEIIATAVFVWVILGVTSSRAADGFAPLAIGLTLTLIALVAIPISNGSFNPARSIAAARRRSPSSGCPSSPRSWALRSPASPSSRCSTRCAARADRRATTGGRSRMAGPASCRPPAYCAGRLNRFTRFPSGSRKSVDRLPQGMVVGGSTTSRSRGSRRANSASTSETTNSRMTDALLRGRGAASPSIATVAALPMARAPARVRNSANTGAGRVAGTFKTSS